MNILLVEDSTEKANAVEATLRQTLTPQNLILDKARSFIEAIKFLRERTYELLVLDLVLPIRNDQLPSEDGGKQILSEIVDGTDCRRPSHIICLTAFEDRAATLQDIVEKSLAHIVFYKEADTKWSESLKSTALYVEQRLREAETFPQDYKVDVAIVTSSPIVELKEILRLPCSFIGEHHQGDALDYFSSKWKTITHRNLSVVACAAPHMGMTAACVTACKVIERWRPRFLVMTGLAAGTKIEEQPGDVLVAEAAYDYGSGKIINLENGERQFFPSPSPIQIDTNLHAILQRWERDQTQMTTIQRAWHTELSRTPRLILGLLATGAAVVQSKEYVSEILSSSRKVVGLDMEAYAIFQAAHLARFPRPKVFVAKSVSDFADKGKNDDWQQYAAFTSARFVYEFFTHATELNLGTAA